MCVPNVKSTIDSIHFEWNEKQNAVYNIHEYIKLYFSITDPHNKLTNRIYEHTMRTMKIAERLMAKEVVDRDVVLISLLLHDIGKTLCDNSHNLVSFRIAELLLEKYKYPEIKRKKILDCILYHSAKDISTLDLTAEQKVVMDADILDEVGILSISRTCLRHNDRNCSIHEITKTLEQKYHKVDKESSYLKTAFGLKLYNQKKKIFREQINQLKVECSEFTVKEVI